MSKNKHIYTCYGCNYYYEDKIGENENGHSIREKYPSKHCGQDHFKCPYYLDNGEPLGKAKERGVT